MINVTKTKYMQIKCKGKKIANRESSIYLYLEESLSNKCENENDIDLKITQGKRRGNGKKNGNGKA